jgi:hypothetical protein
MGGYLGLLERMLDGLWGDIWATCLMGYGGISGTSSALHGGTGKRNLFFWTTYKRANSSLRSYGS